MSLVVDLKVQDAAQAAKYYESLLALNLQQQTNGGVLLVGDHMHLKLHPSAGHPSVSQSPAVSLSLTPGMFARILDAGMQNQCQIVVDSPETAQLTDQYGQRWTLCCSLS